MGNKDDEENDICVLDYLLTTETVGNSSDTSLRQILSRVIDKQVEISRSVEESAHPIRVKLAGYLIRVPGYGTVAEPVDARSLRSKERRRNELCICGSGRKYKKCCLELANYCEDVQ